ncbi:MAG: S1C family serine protease [Verrucomicrobiota bacterium]
MKAQSYSFSPKFPARAKLGNISIFIIALTLSFFNARGEDRIKNAPPAREISFAGALEKVMPATAFILNFVPASERFQQEWKALTLPEKALLLGEGQALETPDGLKAPGGTGSGVLITSEGHIVTNYHVLSPDKSTVPLEQKEISNSPG